MFVITLISTNPFLPSFSPFPPLHAPLISTSPFVHTSNSSTTQNPALHSKPPPSPSRRSRGHTVVSLHTAPRLAPAVDASAAAREEDHKHAQENADSSSEQGPSGAAVHGADGAVTAAAVVGVVVGVVDGVSHEGEPDEVAHERYERHEEG